MWTLWKRGVGRLLALLKWSLIAILCVELCSFLIISISNLILYGHVREGSRAVYDPYTLFLQSPAIRPTIGNSTSPDRTRNRTIWMFGGSTTRGATDDDAKTVASFLAKDLNERANGLHVTVVNFGINSFNSLMEIKYLEKALIEDGTPPDLILFYDGANDTKYFLEHRTPDGHYGYRRVRALIEGYYGSWFGVLKPLNAAIQASFTRELYDKLNQVAFSLDAASPELAAMVDKTEQRYDFATRLAAGFGAKFLLAWQPMVWTEACPVSAAVAAGERTTLINSTRLTAMRDNFTVAYSALANRFAAKPYFASLTKIMCGRHVPLYQADGVHLNDDGRRTVAAALAQLIRARYLGPRD